MALTNARRSTERRPGGAVRLALTLACAGLTFARADVPVDEAALATSYAGPAQAEGTPAAGPVRSSGSLQVTAEHRWVLSGPHLFLSAGVQADNFFFAGHSTPSRLQDYAATVSFEYFLNDENVAALSVRPGFYFERKFTTKAWDVPVDFFSGVPIAENFTGVVGVSNARFYHHALPVLGVIWNVTPLWRIEALYPEPAVVYVLGPRRILRLGGRLTGGGFLSDSRPRRAVVEYECYRVGLELAQSFPTGAKVALEAGWEADRNFDFFRTQGRERRSGAAFLQVSLTQTHTPTNRSDGPVLFR